MTSLKYIVFLSAVTFFWACDSKPKVIVADETANTDASSAALVPSSNSNTTPSAAPVDVHQVVANEILQSERYTYLNVSESGKNFWIATAKTEAVKGQTYFYRGGLMKTNFESLEFKKTFDTIYLVSNIINANQHPGGQVASGQALPSSGTATSSPTNLPEVKDAVKLSDLMKNKAKYEGKIITVAGECVKVNNGIMGRNWAHIQDGTKENGKTIDLTVTTNQNIAVGSKVALKGKIVLNKDFGAGYRYDVIMEDAGM